MAMCTRSAKLSSVSGWISFQPMPSTEDLTAKIRSPGARELEVLIADESKEPGVEPSSMVRYLLNIYIVS